MYRFLLCTTERHDFAMLAVAAGVCVASFLVTGILWSRKMNVAPQWKMLWACGTGLVSGGGAWATHFIAMLAYKPPMPMHFDLALTLASLAFGVSFATCAFIANWRIPAKVGAFAAGALFATGIVGLHFIGTLAIRIQADRIWAPDLVVASVLVCTGLATAGFLSRRRRASTPHLALACALLLASVLALHFVAMSAVTFSPNMLLPSVNALASEQLATIVAIATAISLLIVSLLAVADLRINLAQARASAQSEFLAAMSHELRTPLTSIIAYAEMIEEAANEDGRKTEASDAQVILKASRHLLSLISEILDFSKIEAGKISVQATAVQVPALIDDVRQAVAPVVAQSGNTLHVRTESNIGEVAADLFRLKQCLLNLISNAAKFASMGTISLVARAETRGGVEGVCLTVADAGIGIPPDAVKRLFEPFTQADESIQRRYGGTGLGLAITKQLVLRMGGEIDVKSEVGVGSAFSIWLPRPTSATAPAPLFAPGVAQPA